MARTAAKRQSASTKAKTPATLEWSNDGIGFQGGAFLLKNQDALQACTESGSTLFQNTLAINNELMSFVSERIQNDVKTMTAFASCKSPKDVVDVQSDFMEQAIQDYSDEATKILRMSTDAAMKAIEPIEASAAEVFRGVQSAADESN